MAAVRLMFKSHTETCIGCDWADCKLNTVYAMHMTLTWISQTQKGIMTLPREGCGLQVRHGNANVVANCKTISTPYLPNVQVL